VSASKKRFEPTRKIRVLSSRTLIAIGAVFVCVAMLSPSLIASKPEPETRVDATDTLNWLDLAYPAAGQEGSPIMRGSDGTFTPLHNEGVTPAEFAAQTLPLRNGLRDPRINMNPRFPARFEQSMEVNCAGTRVYVRPVGASLRSTGQLAPNGTLVFMNAFENCDVAYRCTRLKAEEFLCVHAGNSASWSWDIYLQPAGIPLHPRLNASGVLELLNAAGTACLRVDAPEGKDAQGRKLQYGNRLSFTLDQSRPGALRLTLNANLNGLAFPIVIDPSWSATASMLVPRANHTTTVLGSGLVLVAGGSNGSGLPGTPISECELYDPAGNLGAGSFTATGSMTAPRSQHTATLLLPADGRVFVAGGLDSSNNPLATGEVYDPGTGSWTAIVSTMSAPRTLHAASLLNTGVVVISGGTSGGGIPLKNVDLFDPANGFSVGPPMITARMFHTSTTLASGLVLAAGGEDSGGNPIVTAETFDPSGSGAWTSTAANMSTARFSHKAMLLSNGQVLIAGGFNPGLFPSAETYDPASNSFNPTGSMSRVRTEHRIGLLKNSKVILCGCHDGSFANVELFDPFTSPLGSFQITGSMVQPHTRHTVTTLADGRILVVAGFTGSYLSNAEIYDPRSEPVAQTVTANGPTALAIAFQTSSIDDNAPSFAVASQPANGVLSGTGNNRVYTANPGYSGSDSFTFTSTDTFGVSKPATIAITVNSLVPTVSDTSPNASIAGSSGFTIVVNGSGFVRGSQVQFNGSNRTTTFVSTTQLKAQISASDVAIPGNAAVTVSNPAPGGGISQPQTFITMGGALGVWMVTNRLDSGTGSLRFCMNNVRQGDKIIFDQNVFALVNSSAATVINILSQLPTMDKGGVTIDASDTRVTINGSGAGSSYGLLITSDNNLVLGMSIVGFTKDGIGIIGGKNNQLGGSRALPVVGTGPNGQGLRIAGNGAFGVEIDAGGSNNIVKGCWIGLDASGAASQPNLAGILMQNGSNNNQIGSTLSDEANFISGNLFEGVTVSDVGTNNNLVMGNIVGASALNTTTSSSASLSRDIGDGFSGLGGRGEVSNGGAGVFLSKGTTDTQVGGDSPGQSNGIGFNGGNGVEVRATLSKKNSSKGNKISKNKKGGIALFDGSNNGIQPPQIDLVYQSAVTPRDATTGTTGVHIAGHAGVDGTVEIFTDPDLQGGSLWGRTPCTGGSFQTDIQVKMGENITATLTDANGNTSPFSVFGPAPSFGAPSINSPLSALAMVNTAFSMTLTAGGTQPITFGASGLPPGLVLSDNTISGVPTISGTYMVHITATNSAGTDSQTLILVVNSDFTIDGDGDGVPDWLETLAGTDSNNAISFPATQDPLSVDKIAFKLGAGTAPDTLQVQLRITLPAGLITTGSILNLQVGNIVRPGLMLDAKGHSSKGTTSVIVKPSAKGSNTLTIVFSVKKDRLKTNLAGNGFIDETTGKSGKKLPLSVGLAVTSGTTPYVSSNSVSVLYTATKGKGGSGKNSK
jgi:hypothetical protein